MNKTKQVTIKISDIEIDGGTQQRERINTDVVVEYVEAMRCGARFPPVTVFHDGVRNWLADGFHRFHACREVHVNEVLAEIHVGTQRDAILYSTGANNTHGQRLSNADKRKSVCSMLDDKEWSQWSNKAIAKHCRVTDVFVGKVREEKYPTKPKGQTVCPPPAEKDSGIATSPQKQEPSDNQNEVGQDYELQEAREAIRLLASENDSLKDRLAIGSVDEPAEAKATVLRTMEELREQVRCLEIENAAIKSSRDYFQSENAELKKQVAYWRKQAEKAAA